MAGILAIRSSNDFSRTFLYGKRSREHDRKVVRVRSLLSAYWALIRFAFVQVNFTREVDEAHAQTEDQTV